MTSPEARPSTGNPIVVEGDSIVSRFVREVWLESRLPGNPSVVGIDNNSLQIDPENIPPLIFIESGSHVDETISLILGIRNDKTAKSIPILVLDTLGQIESRERLEEIGIKHILPYPFQDIETFEQTVHTILQPSEKEYGS